MPRHRAAAAMMGRGFFELDTEVLVKLLQDVHERPTDLDVFGLPADARVIGTVMRDLRAVHPNTVQIALESATLPLVPQGEVMPRCDVIFKVSPRAVQPLTEQAEALADLLADEDLTDDKLRAAAEGLLPRLSDALRQAGYARRRTAETSR